MQIKYRMVVKYGEFDKPNVCEAEKVEQLSQGWFRIITLSEDIYVHTLKLLSITFEKKEV